MQLMHKFHSFAIQIPGQVFNWKKHSQQCLCKAGDFGGSDVICPEADHLWLMLISLVMLFLEFQGPPHPQQNQLYPLRIL